MGRMRISLAMIAALCVSIAVRAAEPQKVTDVWLDVDTATGIGDVDDGLMLIQSFHSPEVKIRGISVVFGNAPTALFHLLEMLDAGAQKPAAVIGIPVGFIGAAESKEALARDGRVPYLVVHGRRGGSAMAAAAVNALANSVE